jgi:magnesium and cobalt transporter
MTEPSFMLSMSPPATPPFFRLRRFFTRNVAVIPASHQTEEQRQAAANEPHSLEQQLFANIAKLKALEAYDVMVPRADVVGLDSKSPTADMLRIMRQHRHLRFPVYRHTLDDIIGYVEMRGVFDLLSQQKPLDLQRLLAKPLFVVRSTLVFDLIVQMRQTHTYLALVVDEYGGIDGLVTIEDVIESILGTVQAAADVDTGILPEGGGAFLVDARTELDVLEQHLGHRLNLTQEQRDGVDTVGGLVYLLAGRIPLRGEIVIFDDALQFEILEADPHRITSLRARQRARVAAE